eukprot:TRINITY_DN56361_c0_g1_i1.p1 TRINITY_DN56361_c0_g1~~TRINITY_DN56361_c0_g1_i1.p1  ORF type:complete len:260 (-),score=29.35 TRINITY_DN56361_c0_g1_i1:6-785(-)
MVRSCPRRRQVPRTSRRTLPTSAKESKPEGEPPEQTTEIQSATLQIEVLKLNGDSFDFKFDTNKVSVRSIKRKIESDMGVPRWQQKLHRHGAASLLQDSDILEVDCSLSLITSILDKHVALMIGDRFGSRHAFVIIRSNLSGDGLREAFAKGSAIVGFDIRMLYCYRRGENMLSASHCARMREAGIDLSLTLRTDTAVLNEVRQWADLWLGIAKLGSDFEHEVQPESLSDAQAIGFSHVIHNLGIHPKNVVHVGADGLL